MPKFRVNYYTGASGSLVVEAKDEDEAIEIADAEGMPSLCAHCSGWGKDYSMDVGDWEPDETYPVELIEE